MQNVALPNKEAVVMKQIKGPEGALLAMKFNHYGNCCLEIGTN
jgi:hypothetical protein